MTLITSVANQYICRLFQFHIIGFLFHTVPKSEKLSTEDAKFVDVIHSAGLWIGTDEVVGIKNNKYNLLNYTSISCFASC